MKSLLKRLLPVSTVNWLMRLRHRVRMQRIRMNTVEFGGFRRTTPISKDFNFDRGLPIDRYYIEKFLDSHAADIQGHVLEFSDSFYTDKFGQDRVTKKDVWHVVEGNPDATIIADLTDAGDIPSDCFDCIIFTQSLQMIYDFRAALQTLHRILKPGGVVLCTTAGISKIWRRLGQDDWGEYWHFTAQACDLIFNEAFPNGDVEITTHGNVLSAISFLHGLATNELTPEEFDVEDPDYELIIGIRAVKAG